MNPPLLAALGRFLGLLTFPVPSSIIEASHGMANLLLTGLGVPEKTDYEVTTRDFRIHGPTPARVVAACGWVCAQGRHFRSALE